MTGVVGGMFTRPYVFFPSAKKFWVQKKYFFLFSFLGPLGPKNDDSAVISARKIREHAQKSCYCRISGFFRNFGKQGRKIGRKLKISG